MDESQLLERAQSAEAKLQTLQDQIAPLKEKTRMVCETLCAREKSDGSFDIDYVAFAERLGLEGAMELRAVIDEVHNISGAAGDKPRVRMQAVSG